MTHVYTCVQNSNNAKKNLNSNDNMYGGHVMGTFSDEAVPTNGDTTDCENVYVNMNQTQKSTTSFESPITDTLKKEE